MVSFASTYILRFQIHFIIFCLVYLVCKKLIINYLNRGIQRKENKEEKLHLIFFLIGFQHVNYRISLPGVYSQEKIY